MATIYDIAKHVGVSAGTVSRALTRPDKVLPATRKRIEQAAAKLGYVPNTVARTLKTQRSGKILVTVPDIANPFFAQILQGAEEAAQAAYDEVKSQEGARVMTEDGRPDLEYVIADGVEYMLHAHDEQTVYYEEAEGHAALDI